MTSTKPVIAIDIDEVLAQFLTKLTDYHNTHYGTALKLDHYHSYDFNKVWGGSIEECSKKIRDFFDSELIHELDVLPGALEALRKLKQDFSLHVVTARHDHAEQLTKCWINRNFPDIFEEIHFGNHYSSKSRTKAEICRSIHALLLVDDSIVYARNCATEGIPVILFGNYPWNRPHENDKEHFEGDWMIKEVSHWNEVVDLVYQRLLGRSKTSTDTSVKSYPEYSNTSDSSVVTSHRKTERKY